MFEQTFSNSAIDAQGTRRGRRIDQGKDQDDDLILVLLQEGHIRKISIGSLL